MFDKLKIKNKILLLFTFFTFALLSIVIVYFYIHGSVYIKDQAVLKTSRYASQFINLLDDEIKHSVIEIASLRRHLTRDPIGDRDITPPAFLNDLEHFYQTYINKYYSITVFNENTLVVLRPVRLFTGDIIIQRDVMSAGQLNSDSPIFRTSISDNNETVFSNISITDSGIHILSAIRGETIWRIIFHLRLDTIANSSIDALNPDPETIIAIYDNAGIAVFSNDHKYLHTSASQLIGGVNHDFFDDLKSTQLIEQSGIIIKSLIETINSTLLVKYDISSSVSKLNKLAFQSILFLLVLFGFVTSIIFTVSNRISKSITDIARVADNVAAGNLDQKIEVDRKDELGVLINSFNQMVEKLKASYEHLQDINKELEQKIDELTATKAILSEKEKLAVIGETVSKISHDIQNKIGGISIWVQNMEMQYSGDETALIYINEIKNNLNSFLYMLINFKKFYRVPHLNVTQTDINRLIRNVAANYISDTDKKRVNIALHLADNVPLLPLDPMLIEEVMINVLLNSAYFSPENSTIIIKSELTDGTVVIEITDEGPGVGEEIRDKIFQPFFTTKSSGSGLGLAIAKNVIDAHYGNITVFDNESGGAGFHIVLPVKNTSLNTDKSDENIDSR